jgi:hypothetical protein
MIQHDKIRIKQLPRLELEFQQTLLLCLKQCERGRWGLFGAHDKYPELKVWLDWPEVDRLHELAASIRAIRAESGEQNPLCEEFLALCTLHKANDPGEPKLARTFLEGIESQDSRKTREAEPRSK